MPGTSFEQALGFNPLGVYPQPPQPYRTPYSPPPGPQQDIGSLLAALASPAMSAFGLPPPQPSLSPKPGIDPGLLGSILGNPMGSQQAMGQSVGGALSERAFTLPPQAEPQAEPQAAPPQEPVGQLPDIQGPGDLDLAGQRAASEKKLAQLTALRDISEGLGTYIPVKGDIVFGREGRGVEATGIREAMGREEFNLAEMSAQDKLRLKAKLAQETDAAAIAAQAAAKGPAAPKQLKSSDLKGYEAGKNFLREAGEIHKQIEGMSRAIGPIDNIIQMGWSAIGHADPDKAEFRRKVTQQLNLYIKEMTGAQLSNSEARRLKKGMPKLSDGEPEFRAKLEGIMEEVKAKTASWVERRRSMGFDMSFADEEAAGELVKVTTGGRTGMVPANQVAGFKAKYGG